MKRKHEGQNRKGSVLLTVMCFTLVCILLATAALNDAHVSMKQSNASIQKTQAQVSAEDYLTEYLKSYGGTYSDISTLAGTDVSHPNEVTVQMQDSTGTNIDANQSGGSCKMYIYRTGTSGVVVKSQVTYADETDTASAYFDAPTTTHPGKYDSTSAIETMAGCSFASNANQAVAINGDTILETGTPTDLIRFANGKLSNNGTLFTDGNLEFSNNSGAYFTDNSADGQIKPSNVIAQGYIFWRQAGFTTNVGKYDVNFKRAGETGYDSSNLSNRDGYILTDKKFVNIGLSDSSKTIGNSTNPIDIYCHGAYFGLVPTNTPDYADITSIYVDAKDKVNPSTKIYGNLYSYKGSTVNQNGDLYIICNNDTTINGDVCVDGDIYLSNKLTVTGTLYCSGNIYVTNQLNGAGAVTVKKTAKIVSGALTGDLTADALGVNHLTKDGSSDIILSAGGYSEIIPTSINPYARCVMPRLKYDPARFDPWHVDATTGAYDKRDPERKSPITTYANKTASDMFRDNTSASKNIKTKYQSAYDSTKDKTSFENNTYVMDSGSLKKVSEVLTGLTAESDIKNKMNNYHEFYVKANYRFNYSLMSNYYYDVNTGVTKIHVMMPDSSNDADDIVLILPAYTGTGDVTAPDILVDNSAISNANRQLADDELPYDAVTNPYVPKIFCYVMKDCGDSTSASNQYVTGTTSDWNLQQVKITDEEHTDPEHDFVDSKIHANNIFVLVPDGDTLRLKGQNHKCIQACIYATGAKVEMTPTGSGEAPVYGQLLTNSYKLTQDGATVSRFLPASGSILDFIAGGSAHPVPSTVTLKYFTANQA